MRSFRISLLAGAGVAALGAGLLVPGVAAAADLDSQTIDLKNAAGEVVASYSATDLGDCKVQFTLEEDDAVNWRIDYRVDNEDAYHGAADPDDPTQGLFRPVLVSNQGTYDAIQSRGDNVYDIDVGETVVDLRDSRIVPTGEGAAEVTTAEGVAPNATGEHTVSFKMYSGTAVYYRGIAESVGEITVTGCPTEGAGGGGLGSADIFGSLSELGAGSLEGLLPELG